MKSRTNELDFCGSLEYTEDNVPVYKLYLENIPQTITRAELGKYFSTFGEVSAVSIIKNRELQGNFIYGFVEFTKPEFAAMVLKKPIHQVMSKCLRVKPADTWKQPVIARIARIAESRTDAPIESSSGPVASILSLNDDCMSKIFSFLTQIDILKLYTACQRFDDMVHHAIKVSNLFDFNRMQQHLTLMEVREILRRFGSDISRIRLSGSNAMCNRYLNFITKYCSCLKEIDFELSGGLSYYSYKRFLYSSIMLGKISLKDCNISDNICGMLRMQPGLTSVNLANNADITGQYLCNLKCLNVLNLYDCINLKAEHFIELCKSLKLTTLNIAGCNGLNDEAFDKLVNTQSTTLVDLTIGDIYDADRVDVVGKLAALRRLRILREGFFTNEGLLREICLNRWKVCASDKVRDFEFSLINPNGRKRNIKMYKPNDV